MPNAFIRKLDGFERLREDDRAWLLSLCGQAKVVEADQHVHLILEGFAMRYKLTSEGRRQIFAYMIPGDFCNLHLALLRKMDHAIGTLSPCKVVALPPNTILELTVDVRELDADFVE